MLNLGVREGALLLCATDSPQRIKERRQRVPKSRNKIGHHRKRRTSGSLSDGRHVSCLSEVLLQHVWAKFFIVFEWSSYSLCLSEFLFHCVWVKFFIAFEWSSSSLSLCEVLHCVLVKFFITFEWGSSSLCSNEVLLHCVWVKFFITFEWNSFSLCLSEVLFHFVWVKFFFNVFEWSSSSMCSSEVLLHCVWVKFFFIVFEWSSSSLCLSKVRLHWIWVKFFFTVFEWSSSFLLSEVLLHYVWVKFFIAFTSASIYLLEVFVGSSDQWLAPERSYHVSEKCQGASRKCFDFFFSLWEENVRHCRMRLLQNTTDVAVELSKFLMFCFAYYFEVLSCTVTVFQALDMKTTQLNEKQKSGLALHLIFHRFSPFNCYLSVVL